MATIKPTQMRIPPELLAEVDARRGVLSRTQFVISAIRQSLARHDGAEQTPVMRTAITTKPKAAVKAKPAVPPEQALCVHEWQRLGYMTRCTVCGLRR